MRGDAMKRLTEKRDCGNGILYWLSCPDARHCAGGCAQCDTVDKAIDRLGEYEDTGLTPAEIERTKMEIKAGCVKAIARTYGIDINRLRQLAEADRARRVIVLPCKEGTKVYKISWGLNGQHEIEECVFNLTYFDPARYGRDYFLNHEEAEKALEEAKNNG